MKARIPQSLTKALPADKALVNEQSIASLINDLSSCKKLSPNEQKTVTTLSKLHKNQPSDS
ncbi:hypothetical protein, partial [Vibrio sp. 10N.222.49.A4]|uniref:hypothetical protein n=1 Tax=Vibrio sp. 10N.222.49.A4 TaxID=3229612 RepID=UPI00354FE137